jgi:hypothetical protein
MWMYFWIILCVIAVFSWVKTSFVLYICFCIYMTYSTSCSHFDWLWIHGVECNEGFRFVKHSVLYLSKVQISPWPPQIVKFFEVLSLVEVSCYVMTCICREYSCFMLEFLKEVFFVSGLWWLEIVATLPLVEVFSA